MIYSRNHSFFQKKIVIHSQDSFWSSVWKAQFYNVLFQVVYKLLQVVYKPLQVVYKMLQVDGKSVIVIIVWTSCDRSANDKCVDKLWQVHKIDSL